MDLLSWIKAKKAQQTADNVQNQLNQAVVAGDQLAETQQARVGKDGTVYDTLNDRLNGEKGQTEASLVTTNNRIDGIDSQLTEADKQSATLLHGLSAITTDQATATAVRLFGRTLVNLLGKDGNFENWSNGVPIGFVNTVDSNISLQQGAGYYGSSSLKLANKVNSGTRGIKKTFSSLTNGKHYILIVDGDASAITNGGNGEVWFTDGTLIQSKAVVFSSGESKQTKHAKFLSDGTENTLLITVYLGGGASNYFEVDGIRLYEIPQSIYDKIDVDPAYTGDALADKFPYVDSVQHVMNPYVKNSGKNLIPAFTSGKWTLHANAKVLGDYELELDNVTSTFELSSFEIPCLPNTTYTISIGSNNGRLVVETHDKDDNFLGNYNEMYSAGSYTFTTLSNVRKVRIYLDNGNTTSGTYNFAEPQLELNDIKTPFEPQNESYLYVAQDADKNPISLASNNDGSVADEVYQRDGQWYRLNRFKRDMVLDGSLGWTFGYDFSLYKQVMIPDPTDFTINTSKITKYDGSIIGMAPNDSGGDGPNLYQENATNLYLTISDTDSGWGETYTPSSGEIKSLFYGWKMNNGTFGTAYGGTGTKTWVPIGDTDNTRATTVLPTADAPTISEGKIDHYKLTYQLAQATEEAIEVEGSLDLIDGGNQLQIGEAVIVREKVSPSLLTGVYVINSNGVTFLSNGTNNIMEIYKNGEPDNKWRIYKNYSGTSSANGGSNATIPQADFDTEAEYTVTYIALDTYKLSSAENNVEVTYDTNLKTVVNVLVQRQEDDETDISVLKIQMIDAIARLTAGGL